MAVWDKWVLLGFILILAGAAGQHVNYPPPVCAVEGSTVTLPCTFTRNETQDGTGAQIETVRVRWCQNHLICHGSTPVVYDSQTEQTQVNPRYKYLGDLEGNCTLQIKDVNKKDQATLRFRMEANRATGHYTGTSGVGITVVEGTEMKIESSTSDNVMPGQMVKLHCTTVCTFHNLEVAWYRDGNRLEQSGLALHLGPLTAHDSGNYTCALTKVGQLSPPYLLNVEEQKGPENARVDNFLTVRVVLFTLHSLLIVIVACATSKALFLSRQQEKQKSQQLKSADSGDQL